MMPLWNIAIVIKPSPEDNYLMYIGNSNEIPTIKMHITCVTRPQRKCKRTLLDSLACKYEHIKNN